jgi:hypothetical protein
MDDDEKKKSVAFAVKFLKNFDVMKDIRDNTWPALVHGAFSKAAQIEGMSVSAFIEREQAKRPHKEMVSALMGPGPHNYNPEQELDLDTYERLCAALAYTLRNGKKLNPWEEQFVADALENKGTGKRPKGKSGPDKRKNQLRDHTLWRCAQAVADACGLMLYSNYNLEKTTASQIVSAASRTVDDKILQRVTKKVVNDACGKLSKRFPHSVLISNR